MSEFRRKLVIVGDMACGKTCLLTVFAKGTFPESFIPTVFESWVADVTVDAKCIELALWDTAAGQTEYEQLRPLSYPDAHVVLICFAIDRPDSLDNVREKWIAEVLHFCRGLPFFLVGCKTDLRAFEEEGKRRLTPGEGKAIAHLIGAQKYLECSAKSGEGVTELFQHATRAAVLVPSRYKGNQKRGPCIVV
ncbi:small GTPase-binding protein [Mycena vulgaris]|nr:small GTPase-binding protein [Mycena vulgaris]KAJ6536606.1 small GTPase-binding protein [Mycena vulgaris]